MNQIASLDRVAPDHRPSFIHDRLMSAIDDICDKHRGGGAAACFNKNQILVIKDIAFHIAYILDPKNQPPRGLWNSIRQGWKETAFAGKVGIVLATLTIIGMIWAGGLTLWQTYISPFFAPTASAQSGIFDPPVLPPSPLMPPAANSPPNSG
jgi:hypothetical protein